MQATIAPLLQLNEISLRFGGIPALADISFDVREHEVRAIIGPNGAGKSSMLNVINGIYFPQGGEIIFRGEKRSRMSTRMAAAAGIARTFQNIALFQGMTVLDNVIVGRNLKFKANLLAQAVWFGSARREENAQREKAEEIIELLELERFRKKTVSQLSYGLQKRVELARALAAEPRILLLDEPMAGMNAEEKRDMCRFILTSNRRNGTTVILIEHDMGVVMDISDRIVVLDYGRKIADGLPQDIRNSEEVIRAYLGRSEQTE